MNIDTQKIIPLFKEYGIERAGIFGSYARGEERTDSDIDIMVLPSRGMTLPLFIRLERKLAEALGKEVDLVSERSLKERLREDVKNDLQIIYERD